jgi:hypothetical protein
MTRQEITGVRSLDFSSWVRKNLPDSATGFSASDLDFVLWNWKTKKVMLLEIKTRNSTPRIGQKIMWSNLNRWVKNGIDSDWTYLGFHLVVFERTSFDDGKCFFDNKEITESELIKKLSL